MASINKPTALIVDDEPLLLLDLEDMLDEIGYSVILAGSADEAMSTLRERDDISVVITDIEMPGSMNGLGLARIVREQMPAIRLIVVSGRASHDASEVPSGATFFSKPCDPSSLKAAVLA